MKYYDNLSDYRFLGNLEGGKLYYCCYGIRTILPEYFHSLAARFVPRLNSPRFQLSKVLFFFFPFFFFFSFLNECINFARLSSLDVISLCSKNYLFYGRSNTTHLVRSFPTAAKLPCARTSASFNIYKRRGFRGRRTRNYRHTF